MRYAIVTGGTQGIGKAVIEKLLSQGFSIATCARSKEDLQALEKKWKKEYPYAQLICQQADFYNKEDVRAFAEKVINTFPFIDVLVNNAGLFLGGSIEDEPEGHLESLMQLNMFSAYHLTRQALPLIKKSKNGHIFNMCSVASLKAYPGGASYGISKYAMLGFSENLREELKPYNIRVTSVCTGATYTRSWQGSGIGAERMMKSEDVAEMLWSAHAISTSADVESIVMRPIQGDI